MERLPVLYLDLDDTLISWAGGSPHAAPGAREFILWALARFEVRWLTTWCPDGRMPEGLLNDLAKMLDLPVQTLAHIRGMEWDPAGSKVNGVNWLEHVVLGRPFVWLEDDYGFGDRERRFLQRHRLDANYRHCNVTADPGSLTRAHLALDRWLSELSGVAA